MIVKVVPTQSTNGQRINECGAAAIRLFVDHSLTALDGLIISLQKKLKSGNWDRSLGTETS